MAQKPETRFRVGKVDPFLKTLKNTFAMTIQQKAIHGDPDKLLCVCGHFVALELKSAGGKARPLQEWKGSEIRRCGGLYIVTSPDNWEDTKNLLLKLDQGGTP